MLEKRNIKSYLWNFLGGHTISWNSRQLSTTSCRWLVLVSADLQKTGKNRGCRGQSTGRSEITGISLQSDITKTLTLIRKSNKLFSSKSLRNPWYDYKRKTKLNTSAKLVRLVFLLLHHWYRKILWWQTNVITTILPLFKGLWRY